MDLNVLTENFRRKSKFSNIFVLVVFCWVIMSSYFLARTRGTGLFWGARGVEGPKVGECAPLPLQCLPVVEVGQRGSVLYEPRALRNSLFAGRHW